MPRFYLGILVVAAAIAAAFNTPMAAVIFSLEEIVGDMNAPVLGAVVIASATAWMVLRLLLALLVLRLPLDELIAANAEIAREYGLPPL